MGILDIIYPRLCVSCKRLGGYICSDCLHKLHLKRFQICPVCTKRSINGATHLRCKRLYGMDGLTSVFVYQGVVRKLVGKLKYGLVSDLKDDLLELMASFGDFVVIASQKWLVTAVPLHVARARERGFNQAELLAYAISEYFGWPVENKILSRNTKTVKQMNLNKKERLANVRAAFEISEDMKKVVAGKRILLVDDVWTTGATLRENAKMLKRAGAKVVWGLAFAA